MSKEIDVIKLLRLGLEEGRRVHLISVANAKTGDLPFTKKTCYKFSSEGKHPGLFVKVGGKLFFDMEKWAELVEEGRK